MMLAFDHLVIATPVLAHGVARLRDLCGVEPSPGGGHPGAGTSNALFGLGPAAYVEIVGPHPDGAPAGSPGDAMARLEHPRLSTFAVRSRDLDASIARIERAGFRADPVYELTRRRADGQAVTFRIAVIAGHDFGSAMPFIIDWRDAAHPAGDLEPECRLRRLTAVSPDVRGLGEAYAALGLDIPVRHGVDQHVVADLETPRGLVRLKSGAWIKGARRR